MVKWNLNTWDQIETQVVESYQTETRRVPSNALNRKFKQVLCASIGSALIVTNLAWGMPSANNTIAIYHPIEQVKSSAIVNNARTPLCEIFRSDNGKEWNAGLDASLFERASRVHKDFRVRDNSSKIKELFSQQTEWLDEESPSLQLSQISKLLMSK